jgi:DNA polymerase-3 subunit epsilon
MSVRRCLIIDTETTGTDATKDRMIEFAGILYSVTNKTILAQYSTLFPSPDNAAEHVNRIPVGALAEMAEVNLRNNEMIRNLLAAADVIVAHNADFDKQFFKPEDYFSEAAKQDWPWVCTWADFEWPGEHKSKGLAMLALDFGIPVVDVHRALNDCIYITKLFNVMDDLPGMFTKAMRPKATFQSMARPFDDNDLVKSHGFRWTGDKVTGWRRTMAVADAALLPFPVREVK